MMQNDENVVKASASAAENDDHSEKRSTEKRTASRWIEEDEKTPETPKKKSPYIQIPVIIAICIFAASLLAFFAYKYIFIAEPEGVTWTWHSDDEDVDWYFEFKDNNIFKADFGSFEITTNYLKDKNDSSVNKLTFADASLYGQNIGCIFLGTEIDYTISGNRLAGDQKMTLTYPDDEEETEFVLEQTKEKTSPLDLPEDFKEDEKLTGEWVNVFSTDSATQTYIFNDDGSMELTVKYQLDQGHYFEIRRNCTYTVDKNEINITWVNKDPVVHHAEYTIKDGTLLIDGAYFTRPGSKATPDEAKK